MHVSLGQLDSMEADVMEAIRQIHAVAPVQIGDVLLHDAAGTGADIVATKNIPVATGFREN